MYSKAVIAVVLLLVLAFLLGACDIRKEETGKPMEGVLKILFATDRDASTANPNNYEIYMMNVDGSNPINLTNNPAIDWSPSCSPNGTKIAFASDRDSVYEDQYEIDSRSMIFVMDSDGSNLIKLTNTRWDCFPSWSPDGQKIAYSADRDYNIEIFVMNTDGSSLTNLTNNPATDEGQDWSPDGTRIVFMSERDGNCNIYVMNVDGSNLTRLTDNPDKESQPSWSPDGTKIAYTRHIPEQPGNPEVYVMNADGSNQTRLTNSLGFDGQAVWSPDCTKIAFVSTRDGNGEIYVMDADGSNQTNLTKNEALDRNPCWSLKAVP